MEIKTQKDARIYLQRFFFLAVLTALLGFSGCAQFNGTRLEGLLGGDQDLIKLAYDIADDLESRAFPPMIPRHPEQPLLTTTFVNNNNLEETSRFSRILQEHMTSRFVQLGYTVREIKLRNELNIKPKSGELILSRRLSQIRTNHEAQAVSVGTYSISNRNIYISARIVDPVNLNILSSADYKIVMDRNMLAMFGLQLTPQDDMDFIDEPGTSFMNRLLY